MKLERLPLIRSSLKPSNHPYLNGAWTPLMEEVNAFDLDVIEGRIPSDIDGIYLRNTENQVHQPLGRYHPFDGDAMIHQISFRDGKANYRNRFVRTRCFQAEQGAEAAMKKNPHLRAGLNVYKGTLTYGAVGEAQNLPFKTAESVLGL